MMTDTNPYMEWLYRHIGDTSYFDISTEARNLAWAAWQAARATPADHSRDSVIEECAAVLDRRINGWRSHGTTILSGQIVADELEHHAHAIRALKSQQDAAIESQRSDAGE